MTQIGDSGEITTQQRRVLANSDVVALVGADWDFQPEVDDEFTVTTGVPFTDTYTIVLSAEPSAPVTVRVEPQETRTSRGQVVTFDEHGGRDHDHDPCSAADHRYAGRA